MRRDIFVVYKTPLIRENRVTKLGVGFVANARLAKVDQLVNLEAFFNQVHGCYLGKSTTKAVSCQLN
jgi:hypothetical protein